jgi:hypothetical protein
VRGTRIHYGAGYTGNGVGASWLVGRTLAALVLREELASPLLTRHVPRLPRSRCARSARSSSGAPSWPSTMRDGRAATVARRTRRRAAARADRATRRVALVD